MINIWSRKLLKNCQLNNNAIENCIDTIENVNLCQVNFLVNIVILILRSNAKYLEVANRAGRVRVSESGQIDVRRSQVGSGRTNFNIDFFFYHMLIWVGFHIVWSRIGYDECEVQNSGMIVIQSRSSSCRSFWRFDVCVKVMHGKYMLPHYRVKWRSHSKSIAYARSIDGLVTNQT